VQRLGTFEDIMQFSRRALVQARKVWKANFSADSEQGWMCFAHPDLERTILAAAHQAACSALAAAGASLPE
jgi:hypothetical protein